MIFMGIENAVREGHYELAPGFHASHGIISSFYFQTPQVAYEDAKKLVSHITDEIWEKTDTLFSLSIIGNTFATYIANILKREKSKEVHLVSGYSFDKDKNRGVIIIHENALTDRTYYNPLKKLCDFVYAVTRNLPVGIGVILKRSQEELHIHDLPVYYAHDFSKIGINVDVNKVITACKLCKKKTWLDSETMVF